MLTTLLASIVLAPALPENPSFDFSGLPSVPKTTMRTHGVQIDMSAEKVATVTSTTVVKNMGTEPLTTQVKIPRGRIGDAMSGNPTFQVRALWDNKPLALIYTNDRPKGEKLDFDRKSYRYRSDLTQTVTLGPGQTSSLRISYSIPFGRCGYEKKQLIAGYLLDGESPVGQMNISYRYGGPTVFRLPEASPKDWGWQVGARGVFKRLEDFTPNGELTYITFYPGGFENIGDPGRQ